MGLVGFVLYAQFRGDFTPKTKLTMVVARAGLVMDPGSKVTYNGVEIGGWPAFPDHPGRPAGRRSGAGRDSEVRQHDSGQCGGRSEGEHGVRQQIRRLEFTENPAPQSITPSMVIDATTVTTEFNTLFETLTSITEKIDPVKVNLTLSATAQALAGLGRNSAPHCSTATRSSTT